MTDTPPLRIAMWSGPRNISTAMMRSWGNRPDTFVCDEPFYAHYLAATQLAHPGRDEVIAAGETDPRKVIASLTGEVPGQKPVFYQKHMTHHLLDSIPREWMRAVTHCFLIREPGEVIASYLKKHQDPTLEDIGFARQAEIFDWVCAFQESAPPVIDARDVLANPERALRQLCGALGTPFSQAMLSWPAGPRPTDGVWAKHWYAEVESSTAFRTPAAREITIPAHLQPVYEESLEHYRRLREFCPR